MNRTKRFCAIALASMIAVSSLAGCGDSDNSGSGAAGGTTAASGAAGGNQVVANFGDEGKNGETIKLKVWAPGAAQAVFKSQCDKFIEDNKAQAKIEIEVVAQSEADAASQILTDATAGADVFGFACDNLDKLVGSGALLEVVGQKAERTKANNSEASVYAATKDGKLMAYPETGDNSYCLVYDKRFITADDAKSLEGILEACKKNNKKFVMNAKNGFYSCCFMFTGGLKLDGLEETEDGSVQKFTDYDETKVVNTMLAFNKLFTDYKDYIINGEVTKVNDGFVSGEVAAGVDGSWDFMVDTKSLGENAGFAVLPTVKVNGEDLPMVNMFGYKLIGVNSASKFPNAAMALGEYLAGEECQRQRAAELSWGPSNKVVADSADVKNKESLVAILTQAQNSVPQTQIAATFWGPMETFGTKISDPLNPLDETACKDLLAKTIASIKDE